MRRTNVMMLALLATALLAGSAGAAKPQTTLHAVEAELMCDTCRVPLNIAESERADQERREVRQLIAQGLTKQQILDHMSAKWGNDILAVPKGGAASITVWAVPAAIIVLVALGLLLAIPRWRRRTPGGPPGGPPDAGAGPGLSSDDAQRVDRDIAAYDL